MATASDDGTVRVWRIARPALLAYVRSEVHACLTPEQRTRFLGESAATALEECTRCEARFGRTP